MWASNFPVDKVSFSYRVFWNAAKRVCERCGLTEEERHDVFARSAARAYRLPGAA